MVRSTRSQIAVAAGIVRETHLHAGSHSECSEWYVILIHINPNTVRIISNAYFLSTDEWPVEYIIYAATIPSAFTGADVSIFASAFAYISDVSNVKYRTLRVTVLEVCYLTTFPIGITLGSYLFNYVFDHSYIIMFSINAAFLLLAILYSILNLKVNSNELYIFEILTYLE